MSRIPPAESWTAADGTLLAVRSWEVPPGVPTIGSVLLVHGHGEHSERYHEVALACTEAGFYVSSFDHRGHGASGGRRGAIKHPQAMVEDTVAMYERLHARTTNEGDPSKPFVIAHSMGGCIAASAVTDGLLQPRGLVLSAPALRLQLGRILKTTALVLNRLLPNLPLPSTQPGMIISHDEAAVQLVKADPLCHSVATPRLVRMMIELGQRAIDNASTVSVPTLVLVPDQDRHVSPSGSLDFYEGLSEGLRTLHVYEGMYHEIFNEQQPQRQRSIDDVTSWLKKVASTREK